MNASELTDWYSFILQTLCLGGIFSELHLEQKKMSEAVNLVRNTLYVKRCGRSVGERQSVEVGMAQLSEKVANLYKDLTMWPLTALSPVFLIRSLCVIITILISHTTQQGLHKDKFAHTT